MLSPARAAELLDLSIGRVQEFIRTGRIAAENIGTVARPRYVITESEIERFAALTRPAHRPRSITVIEQIATIILENILIGLGANDPDLDAWTEVQRINDGDGWSYDKNAGRSQTVRVEGVKLGAADLTTAYDLAQAAL
jgi:hypothetical protein